jgi:tRNA (mo5U34)-methyltransferase
MQEDAARRAEEAIAKQAKWHHRIEVAPGVVTPGLQQTEDLLAQIGMPDDLTGMRVLDIGARDGFFTFEAEKRGAAEVIALDNEPPHHTGFAIAAELLGSKATYVTENVYSLDEERFGRFDLVLFLGVIYHLRHPLLALDRIHDVTADDGLMLIETHMIDEGLVDAAGNWRKLAELGSELPALPLVQYYPGDMLGSDPTSQWAPNKVALEGWLRGAGFEPERTWQVAFRGGATGRRLPLGATGERAVDEAASWDMTTWTVEKSTTIGR